MSEDWRGGLEACEARVDRVEDGVEENRRLVEECREEGRRVGGKLGELRGEVRKVEERQEESEQEARKYFLLMTKIRRTRRLERPSHVLGLVTKFLLDKLEISDMVVEEAYRVGDGRPQDIRVKFASMKDRDKVLSAGRQFK